MVIEHLPPFDPEKRSVVNFAALYHAMNWWRSNGHFNEDLYYRYLKAKLLAPTKPKPNSNTLSDAR